MESLRVDSAASAPARRAEEVPGDTLELERGVPFCANPACALHVWLVDALSGSAANWVTLPDGRTFGRCRSGSSLLCDACATRRGPVRLVPGPITL